MIAWTCAALDWPGLALDRARCGLAWSSHNLSRRGLRLACARLVEKSVGLGWPGVQQAWAWDVPALGSTWSGLSLTLHALGLGLSLTELAYFGVGMGWTGLGLALAWDGLSMGWSGHVLVSAWPGMCLGWPLHGRVSEGLVMV